MSDRPKLLMTTTTLPRWDGDPEPRFVLDLAENLSDRFDVVLLAPISPGAAAAETIGNVDIVRYRFAPVRRWEVLATPGALMPNIHANPMLALLVPLLVLGQMLAVVRLLRSTSFQVVHCHWIFPQALVYALIGLFLKTPPFLLTCHGGDAFTLDSAPFRWLKKWTIGRSSGVTVVSQDIKQYMDNLCSGRPAPEITHIPMGVDIDRFAFADPAHKGKSNRKPKILFVGRLAEKKGLHNLLDAVSEPEIRDRDVDVEIVGHGPMQSDLEQYSREKSVDSFVRFPGPVSHEDLPQVFLNADVFCTPFVVASDGDREGTPTVIMEAAACGIPIVTSDIGGCRDIVETGQSGWLVQPGDTRALKDALCDAIDDAPKRARMAKEAHRRVQSFSWPNIAGRYADELERTANFGGKSHAGRL